jgi:hypothetical protein
MEEQKSPLQKPRQMQPQKRAETNKPATKKAKKILLSFYT